MSNDVQWQSTHVQYLSQWVIHFHCVSTYFQLCPMNCLIAQSFPMISDACQCLSDLFKEIPCVVCYIVIHFNDVQLILAHYGWFRNSLNMREHLHHMICWSTSQQRRNLPIIHRWIFVNTQTQSKVDVVQPARRNLAPKGSSFLQPTKWTCKTKQTSLAVRCGLPQSTVQAIVILYNWHANTCIQFWGPSCLNMNK